LLFDISGFFDNINANCAIQIFRDKGFPTNLCNWVKSFLTRQWASLKLGDYLSDPFTVSNRTPQGSPLLPILSALYMASLLDLASCWRHHDLTLYVDNGAIFATSTTALTATQSTIISFKLALHWLANNGLSANPAKMELMVFQPCQHPNLTGGHIYSGHYQDSESLHHISMVSSLHYLRVFLTNDLKWDKHISIIVNCAQSTIHGISILGNSIRGLNFMNWRHIYNTLVIPILTYGAQV